MNAFGTAIVWCMIQVTLFGLLAGLLYLASRRQDPRRRALVLLVGVIGVVLLTAMIASPWPDWTSALEDSASLEPRIELTSSDAAPLAADSNAVKSIASSGPNNTNGEQKNVWAEAALAAWNELRQPADTSGVTDLWSWRTVAFLAVAVVAVLGLLRLTGGLLGVAMLRKSTITLHESRLTELVDVLRAELECTRPIALAECPRLATAATIGWHHPLILLPANWRRWTPSELRSVLAHEIAHVCRADFATHLVAQIGLALHFYHPLVHWLVRRLRLEQELAADALAARVSGGQQTYLTTLAGLALAQPSVQLGWPVQAFLPTRGTLLRRIEMLRDRRVVEFGKPRGIGPGGWLAIVLLAVAGIVASGLRAPSAAIAQVSQPPAANNDTDAPLAAPASQPGIVTGTVQRALPPGLYLSIRPALIFRDERMKPIAQIAQDMLHLNLPGFTLQEIEQVRMAHYKISNPAPENSAPEYFKAIVIHVSPSIDLSKRKFLPAYTETLPDGIHVRPGGGDVAKRDGYVLLHDNHTVVIDKVAQLRTMLADPEAAPWALRELFGQPIENYPPLNLLVSPEIFHEEIARMKQNPAAVPLLAFAPLWEKTTSVAVNLHLGQEVGIQVDAVCKSPQDAEEVEKTAQAVLTLAENTLDQKWAEFKQQAPPTAAKAQLAIAQIIFEGANAALASAKLSRSGQIVQLSLTSPADVAVQLQLLLPAVHAARDAALRSQSLNNMKQLALAMHLYADKHGHFPPPVLYGPDGKTPHSWRVALLPFLEHPHLYDQYKLDEPWDSPSNLKVLEKMPYVYRHPKDVSNPTNTSYFVLTGPDTVFPIRTDAGAKKNFGSGFGIITDGTSKTILAVEAKRDIPWTKPEDIPYSADAPLPELGGWSIGLINAAWCDGSVRTMPQDIHEKILRARITKAGGEREADLEKIVP